MSLLLNGDCLEQMKMLDDDSVDLIFCDLPYGQTNCKWDIKIDIHQFWNEIMRIKKLNTPIFMTTTVRFGNDLINTAPKKCPFRYDLVWVKSASCGHLSARKMPMRKHEMVYVFYEKLPFYNLSSHTHKFLKTTDKDRTGKCYTGRGDKTSAIGKYEPPLPNSIIKEDIYESIKNETAESKSDCYGKTKNYGKNYKRKNGEAVWDPPLPDSVIKEDARHGNKQHLQSKEVYQDPQLIMGKEWKDKNGGVKVYDPPLPNSVIKEEDNGIINTELYSSTKPMKRMPPNQWDPPLPTSVVKEDKYIPPPLKKAQETYEDPKLINGLYGEVMSTGNPHTQVWEPALPNSILEVKSVRGNHSTEKPVALMEWVIKYFSKEGDTVLDPTMGSGGTGVACKNLKRNFIGIEMDPDIYQTACDRIEC